MEEGLTEIVQGMIANQRTVSRVVRAGGGGNSRIYRVELEPAENGRENYLCLKSYPKNTNDSRDRLGVERLALEFFELSRVQDVPRFIAADTERGLGLMTWLEGQSLGTEISDQDVSQATDFLIHILSMSTQARRFRLPSASEACTSGQQLVEQIEGRFETLIQVSEKDPKLDRFLKQRLRPFLTSALQKAEKGYQKNRWDFSVNLADHQLSPVPSDFGFHNCMRNREGRLQFVDFEYFGWDDPVKVVTDMLLHPAYDLSQNQQNMVQRRISNSPGLSVGFAERFELLYDLFGVRWCLILLNEFLPERWAIRQHAHSNKNWDAAKQRQLDKAEGLLARVEGTIGNTEEC